MFNLVELLATDEDTDCGFDQKCRYGHRVDGHAVYCHNDNWPDAPRKCRRTWYHGEDYAEEHELRDEDCEGYEPNSNSGQ